MILSFIASWRGTGSYVASQHLRLAEWLLTIPLIGWRIARRSRYGENVALVFCVGMIAVLCVCFIARGER